MESRPKNTNAVNDQPKKDEILKEVKPAFSLFALQEKFNARFNELSTKREAEKEVKQKEVEPKLPLKLVNVLLKFKLDPKLKETVLKEKDALQKAVSKKL